MAADNASWETEESTGLLDDADVTIKHGYFGTDARYMKGEVLLWIFEGESPDAEDGEVRQWYSIGNGWDSMDNGETVEGKEKFNASCNYAMFFTAALELDGVADVVKERGGPNIGNIWDGLRFHMERREIDRGADISKAKVLLPVKFLGVEGEGKGKAKKGKAKKEDGGTNDKAIRAKVKALVKKYDEWADFIDAVHDKYPEVEEHEKLYDEVLDEDEFFAKHS